MANEIQADPARLRQIADDIGKVHTSLCNTLHASNSQVASLKGVWTGEAAVAFNASFQKILDQCSESLGTVERLVNTLYDSADTYERNEKTVQDEAAKMPKLPNNTMR
ncbi:MAG: WXG100 family type VII secretion target [Syntrophomonadaceae bacterium]|nr:WXG100 family type VII secretion target [Syntrophomonadaceae bacterium]